MKLAAALPRLLPVFTCLASFALAGMPAQAAEAVSSAPGSVYYVCPGNVFTNTLSAKEAEARGCRAKEAAQPTTIPAPKNRPPTAGAAAPHTEVRVDAIEQGKRDNDSKKILQDELRKAEEQLAAMRKEYNAGEPERRGDERNYQKYLDRTAELKASIARTEADVAALRRELGLPSAPASAP